MAAPYAAAQATRRDVLSPVPVPPADARALPATANPLKAGGGESTGGRLSSAAESSDAAGALSRWQCINTFYYSVVVITGLSLVVYGLFTIFSKSDLDSLFALGPPGSTRATVLITGAKVITVVLGGLIVLSSLTCGLLGTARKQRCCIACYLGLAFCWMAICLAVGIAVLALQSKIASLIPFGDVTTYGLSTADYNTVAIDAIQSTLSCCGYNGAADYRTSTCLGGASQTPPATDVCTGGLSAARVSVPPSCCKVPSALGCNNGSAAGVPVNPDAIFSQGCKNAISRAVSQMSEAVGSIFIVAAIIHIAMVAFSVCLHSAAEASYKAKLLASSPVPDVMTAASEPPVKSAASPANDPKRQEEPDPRSADRHREHDSSHNVHQHRYRRMSSHRNAQFRLPYVHNRRASFPMRPGAQTSSAAVPSRRSTPGFGRESMYRPAASNPAAALRQARRFSNPS